MRRMLLVLGRTALLTAGLLLGALAAPMVAQAHHPQPEPQPFYADSGDPCPYGFTEGVLAWRYVHAPEVPRVDVRGVVVDRPVASEIACRDDGYYTVATFVAYSGDRAVDRVAERVDNARRDIAFKLAYGGAIDRVVIQVCRHSGTRAQFYCGPPREHTP